MSHLYTLYTISIDLFDKISEHKTKLKDEFSFTLTGLQNAMVRCFSTGICDDYPAGKLIYENGELTYLGVGIKRQYHVATRMAKAGLTPTLNDLFGMKKVLKEAVFERQPDQLNSLLRIPVDFPAISLQELIAAMTTLFNVNQVTCKNNINISVVLKEKASIQVTERHRSVIYPLTEDILNDIRSVKFRDMIEHRYGYVRHIPEPPEKETPVEKSSLCETVKGKVKAIKMKNLLQNLKTAKTPEEAFNLVTSFIGKRTEASGMLIRDNTQCNYRFAYTPEDDVVIISVSIDTLEGEDAQPLFNLQVNADRKNIRQVYSSVIALTAFFR